MRRSIWGLGFVLTLLARSVGADDVTPADAEFFESKVRPLLVARCHECHSADKVKSGLRLDSRDAILVGGESGPAAVPGKPNDSLLVDVISYRNSVQMPPKAKLPDTEIATLTEWIKRGLPWPNSKPVTSPSSTSNGPRSFTDEEKSFWAFRPVKPLPPPAVQRADWPRSPIDRFILAELEANGLQPAPEMDRSKLLRRITIDLTGLLPTPDEVDQFLGDDSPDALERIVDRLLASPRYGERWARHWLDVARYADSNGLDENLAYANAYRYRDYVVKSFREDKPYDRFVIEQIAGDLLEPGSSEDSRFDALVATGFLCLGAKMLAEDDPVKMQMDIIDEQVDTIGRAFLGLTMGCARCHDHKFDPVTMDDYYGLAGIFKSTHTMDTFTVVARWRERPLATPEQIQTRDQLQQQATAQKQIVDKRRSDAANTILKDAKNRLKDYLLAATYDTLRSEQLKTAKPRGDTPGANVFPGALLIEAEDYARGNVLKDRESYGREIGVLVNQGETPNFAEYDINIANAGAYQFELRYAAAGSRPVKVFINGKLIKSDAASQVTGAWTPDAQKWFVESFVALSTGTNVVRLEQPQFFPHIDKLLLTPLDSSAQSEFSKIKSYGLTSQSTNREKLVLSILLQWTKAIDAAKDDSKSIWAPWHQFLAGKLQPAEDAISKRLYGDALPSTLDDLAARYEQLFADAQQAWADLKATETGKEIKTLPDPALEAARLFLNDPKGPFALPSDIESSFPPETVAQLKLDREELARRESLVPKFAETMAVSDSKPENLKIHLRGNHLTLGREVPRQLPAILLNHHSRDLTDGSGRLQLARWLASPEHPLTSRVIVNRVWQWHFGQGLVRSPDNFGRLGERPSHPNLLDWLASDFSANRQTSQAWSLKSLHRRLIPTATYRQSTQSNPAATLHDPENRLLWRFHRQRMNVETLRDSLLQISSSLDETPGGTLLPTANRAYVTSTANVNPAIYNSTRRAVYLPVVRSALYDVFTAFDFADPSTSAGLRDQTTIAPQALFMMNSQFVLDQSRSLATQLLEQHDLDPSAKVGRLYNIAYSRSPSAAETVRALNYINQLEAASATNQQAWTSLTRTILSANEFIYIE